MRRSTPLFFLLLVTLGLVGCKGTTPVQKYAQLQEGYIAAVDILLVARREGTFSNEEWATKILPWINRGNSALESLRSSAHAGWDQSSYLAVLQVSLTSLLPFIERAKIGPTSYAPARGESEIRYVFNYDPLYP